LAIFPEIKCAVHALKALRDFWQLPQMEILIGIHAFPGVGMERSNTMDKSSRKEPFVPLLISMSIIDQIACCE